MNNNVMVGQFLVDGAPVTVEVPCNGVGAEAKDVYKALLVEVRKLCPDAQTVRRIGSKIEKRDKGIIRLTEGQTVRQLFPQNGDEKSLFLNVGQVFFHGSACEIVLRFSRGQDRVHITLRDRLRGTPVNLTGGYILGGALAANLEQSITSLLGSTARDLKLRIE
jgi:hypothetical protein